MNCIVASTVALFSSLVTSCVFYWSELLDMSYIDCLLLSLSLQTVDVDGTASDQSKSMMLATNCFVLFMTRMLGSDGNASAGVELLRQVVVSSLISCK